jgi:hypothetical protein
MSAAIDQPLQTLLIKGFGKLPAVELRALEYSIIEFRYIVEGSDYPGFDGVWRIMSENEQREHLRMGGKIAEWLLSLKQHQQEPSVTLLQ